MPGQPLSWATAPNRIVELLAINKAIVSTLDFNELLGLVIEKTAAFTQADACLLALSDAQGRATVAAAHGVEGERFRRFEARLDEKIDASLRALLGGEGESTFVSVPVMNPGGVQGILAVRWNGQFDVGTEEQLLLSALADTAAIAIGHATGYEKLSLAERESRATEEQAVRARDALVEELRAERGLLEAIVQQMPTGVLVATAPGVNVVMANTKADEILRVPPEDRVRGTERFRRLKVMRRDGGRYPLEERPLARAIFRGESTSGERVLMERADGSVGTIEVNTVPVRNTVGAVTAAVTMLTDISEQLDREDERSVLLAGERDARQQLEKLASDEIAGRSRAEESDRRKDEFLAMLGHELRNPLTALSAALMLRDRLEIPAGASRKVALLQDSCNRQVRNLVRLVDDLLDVSRISQGKVELRKQPIELKRVVQSAIESAQPAIDARKHRLSVSFDEGLFQLDADPTRLEQVLCNLLLNAAKYTPDEGKIALSITREEQQGAPWVAIRVKDNGVGIDPQMHARVFEIFVQIDTAIDRAGGGLGLGLTLVKRLVEMHGGNVGVRSEGRGKGSEFLVRLPLSTHAPLPAPSPEQPPALKLPRRVLVVEDSADIIEVLQVLLEDLGHRVEVARDGLNAVKMILESQPEVALVDVGLPGCDGYEVARRVRADPRGAGLNLIALTGYGGGQAQARALAAGFNRHVVKPISVEVLARLLETSP
jgi:signal transduction histidine kinase/CheY-like chemotaxis protein